MKRYEILDMSPGRELDFIIARDIMGWTYDEEWGQIVPQGHCKPSELWSEYEWSEKGYSRHPVGMMGGVAYMGDKPHIREYSTDIADAWMVIEETRKRGWNPYIEGSIFGKWICMFQDIHSPNSTGRILADTAPLAICLAALLTLLEKEN